MMEYNQELSDKELSKLRVFSDFELNSERAHLGYTLENELEYVGRRLTTNSSVPANIHRDRFFKFWEEELEAPQFVLDTLKNGYSLPFACEPLPASRRTMLQH